MSKGGESAGKKARKFSIGGGGKGKAKGGLGFRGGLSVPPFVPAQAGTNEIAYEDIMINAAEYRAMAWEHHRLAGMCRSPESREQHFRLEKDFLALAASEECLHGTRAAQHPSHSESAG